MRKRRSWNYDRGWTCIHQWKDGDRYSGHAPGIYFKGRTIYVWGGRPLARIVMTPHFKRQKVVLLSTSTRAPAMVRRILDAAITYDSSCMVFRVSEPFVRCRPSMSLEDMLENFSRHLKTAERSTRNVHHYIEKAEKQMAIAVRFAQLFKLPTPRRPKYNMMKIKRRMVKHEAWMHYMQAKEAAIAMRNGSQEDE